MKLITRDTDYALRAICSIAKHKGKVVSVADLVKESKIPRPFLRKILQVLNKKGILHSYKGIGGGFVLAIEPRKIFLTDLIRIFQGEFRLNECFFKKAKCPHTAGCPLRKKICDIEAYVVKELKLINIGSLLEDK